MNRDAAALPCTTMWPINYNLLSRGPESTRSRHVHSEVTPGVVNAVEIQERT